MHTIVPFVGLFPVDKGVLVNLFLVLCLIATNVGRGGRISFLVAAPDFTIFFNYLYKGVHIRISLKLLLKTAGGITTAAVWRRRYLWERSLLRNQFATDKTRFAGHPAI